MFAFRSEGKEKDRPDSQRSKSNSFTLFSKHQEEEVSVESGSKYRSSSFRESFIDNLKRGGHERPRPVIVVGNRK